MEQRPEEAPAGWTADELARIGDAQELELASRREDGTLRRYVTIWAVRAGDQLFVRSAHGRDNPWFRRAVASGTGRIRAGGVERDVRFERPEPEVHTAVDAAYHAKYDHYPKAYVDPVVDAASWSATLRLVPKA